MDDFFTVLKRRRKEKYTQQKFAQALNVSDTTVQNWETNTFPPHEKLLQINSLLNYDFSRLIYQTHVGTDDKFSRFYADIADIMKRYEINSSPASEGSVSAPSKKDADKALKSSLEMKLPSSRATRKKKVGRPDK